MFPTPKGNQPLAGQQLDLIAGDELKSELRRRRSPYLHKTVAKSAVSPELSGGWQVERENKDTVRLRKPKPVDQALEDDVWSLLARVGFPELSKGRHFTIEVAQGQSIVATKQLDVLAADDETALVVECKASAKVAPKSMGKDLAETQGLKGAVTKALREHYGVKKRIGWVYATRGIRWSKSDLARLQEFDIRLLSDNDLEYFQRLADLIGPAARHQLQAEVFGDKGIEELKRTIPAIRGTIAGRRFYQFTIDPERLLKIAFISHRARLDAGTIDAYQRMIKKSRLDSIRQYIDDGGMFPTNIVVNFRTKRRFDLNAGQSGDIVLGTLFLPNTYKSAWVIDGQHRLYGFSGSTWAAKTQLPVLAFEQLPPEEEARLFVDINNKQVKVQRSHLVSLMSELYWGSEVAVEAYHATISRIIAVLGRDIGSPIRNRIVQEGDTRTSDTPLTVTALYEALRRTSLVGTIRKGVLNPGPLYEEDDARAVGRSVEVLGGYLSLFSDALPVHWALGNAEGGYLCTNNGVTALIFVLQEVLSFLDAFAPIKPWQATPDDLIELVAPYVSPVITHFQGADIQEVRRFRRLVGSSGQQRASLAMMAYINESFSTFNPPGLDEYIQSQDQTGTNEARQMMPELQLKIHNATLRLLVDEFGPEEDGWWRLGVPSKVRQEVASRREANPTGGQLMQFFELLDYRSIALANWATFRSFFTYGEGNGKEKQTSWFNQLNEIRNRIAHPERGNVTEDELEFIKDLDAMFDDSEKVLPDTVPS